MFGYQVAFCWRNTAIYGGVLLFGIVYGLARDRDVPVFRWLKKPIRVWTLLLLLLPMAVDGFTHIFGLRDMTENVNMDMWYGSLFSGSQVFSANWWLRIITGMLAALGIVWFIFPRINKVAQDPEELRVSYRQYITSRQGEAWHTHSANANTGNGSSAESKINVDANVANNVDANNLRTER